MTPRPAAPAPPLRFGAFIPPLHQPTENPTLGLQRDLELVEHLDRLGFDEAWFGEHHGLGWETISSPEMFIAAVAQRTQRIRLGTGVISVPFHHPFIAADRMVFLDHLTRGRAIIGIGPGAFPQDAEMMGLDYTALRPRMSEAVEAILALVDSDEPVSRETDWFSLVGARLNLRPFSYPRFEMCMASTVSPSGARLAGQYGLGLLSLASSTPVGFEMLLGHWAVMEEQAAAYGTTIDRSAWRISGWVHLAETEEQARKDVRRGILPFCDYFNTLRGGIHPPELTDIDDIIDFLNESGTAVIGTPEQMIAQIDRFQEQTGGFGAFLAFGHEMANTEATRYSYELMARNVMPAFQGSAVRPTAAYEWGKNTPWVDKRNEAWEAARLDYEAERKARE